jgi:histidinol-phosphatase (PHP family)
MIKKANYHTHTARCKHASGTDEEYVIAAIAAGYDELAFTDHTPWLLYPIENGHNRMRINEMEGYVASIHRLSIQYRDQISIKLGVEAEYYRDRFDWLVELKNKYHLDLLVLGNHFRGYESTATYYGNYKDRTNLYKHYVEDAIDAMATGEYKIFAHPDIFFRTINVVNDLAKDAAQQICDAANHYNVILEYNLGGVRYGDHSYPKPEFWEVVAKNRNASIIGVDAHSPADLLDTKTRSEAKDYLEKIGVNLVEHIEL